MSDAGGMQIVERPEPVDHLTALAFVCAAPGLFTPAERVADKPPASRSVPPFEDRPRYLAHCALLF